MDAISGQTFIADSLDLEQIQLDAPRQIVNPKAGDRWSGFSAKNARSKGDTEFVHQAAGNEIAKALRFVRRLPPNQPPVPAQRKNRL
jgi:hypothetical protein